MLNQGVPEVIIYAMKTMKKKPWNPLREVVSVGDIAREKRVCSELHERQPKWADGVGRRTHGADNATVLLTLCDNCDNNGQGECNHTLRSYLDGRTRAACGERVAVGWDGHTKL